MSKPTMQSIADALDVSRISVWKALHNRPGVSEVLREQVLQKAKELGYLGEKASAQQALSARATVSVVVSRPESSVFWMQIIHQIAKELSRQNMNLMYTYLPSSWKAGYQLPQALSEGAVSGIIVLNIYDPQMLRALSALPAPKVFLDTVPSVPMEELTGDLVLLEGRRLVCQITGRLIATGRRRLGFVGDIQYAQTNLDRYHGFLDALEQNRIPLEPCFCMTEPIHLHRHYEQISAFLQRLPQLPEAFVCASDFIAHYVEEYLERHAPKERGGMVLTGFDNNREYSNIAGAITSVDVQTASLGKRLAQKIAFRMRYPEAPYECAYISSQLVYRPPLFQEGDPAWEELP